MTLDQDLLLQLSEVLDGDGEAAFHLREAGHGLQAGAEHLPALRLLRPTGEREAADIASEPDARHQHDGALAGTGIGQLGRGGDEVVDLHLTPWTGG